LRVCRARRWGSPHGSFATWRSSSGRPLKVAAAWPRWSWSDFLYAALPNGRFLDYAQPGPIESLSVLGVTKQAVIDALYVGGLAAGYLAPRGADPTADLGTGHDLLLSAKPNNPLSKQLARQYVDFKSADSLSGTPAPLLVMNGFTDPIFPAEQALRAYNIVRARNRQAPISLQLGDLGHFRGGEALGLYKVFNADGAAFFDHYLRGRAGGPAPGAVKVFAQGCPKGTTGAGPYKGASWSSLIRGDLRITRRSPRTLTSSGGSTATGTAESPAANHDACSVIPAGNGHATSIVTHNSPGFTLMGPTTIATTVTARGGSYGQIDARLWDVFGGQQRLVDTGIYRLFPRQHGRITFQLFGNAYRFAKGHTIKLELLGRNAPSFLAESGFKVKVAKVIADLPTREHAGGTPGISLPLLRR
jgi:hypothetical protein